MRARRYHKQTMCLILLAHNAHPLYRLVLAANRDEFYARPSRALNYWPDAPEILAGRDELRGGTWLGITSSGRLAAVTNYREPRRPDTIPASSKQATTPTAEKSAVAPSRGELVCDFLKSENNAATYLPTLAPHSRRYDGFNLLAGTGAELFYHSNRTPVIQPVPPGVHGLSNHLLNTDWPKVQRGIAGLRRIVQAGERIEIATLLNLLSDRYQPADKQLPDTGIGLDWERVLAPIFIASPTYGTRCSSVILIDYQNRVTFHEETWRPAQTTPYSAGRRRFEWTIPPLST